MCTSAHSVRLEHVIPEMRGLADKYRQFAHECIEAASGLSDVHRKLEALDMAAGWLRLAEQAEQNQTTDVVYASPGVPLPERPDPSS